MYYSYSERSIEWIIKLYIKWATAIQLGFSFLSLFNFHRRNYSQFSTEDVFALAMQNDSKHDCECNKNINRNVIVNFCEATHEHKVGLLVFRTKQLNPDIVQRVQSEYEK